MGVDTSKASVSFRYPFGECSVKVLQRYWNSASIARE